MQLYKVHPISEINPDDLEGKDLRRISQAIERYQTGESKKHYAVKKGDRLHICENIEHFLYYKYRDEPIYSFEYYDLAQ
jgi:hypothetical protein